MDEEKPTSMSASGHSVALELASNLQVCRNDAQRRGQLAGCTAESTSSKSMACFHIVPGSAHMDGVQQPVAENILGERAEISSHLDGGIWRPRPASVALNTLPLLSFSSSPGGKGVVCYHREVQPRRGLLGGRKESKAARHFGAGAALVGAGASHADHIRLKPQGCK